MHSRLQLRYVPRLACDDEVVPSPRAKAATNRGRWILFKPLLLQACKLAPIEKVERRVLVLADPGRGDQAMQATSSIYC